MSAWLSWLNAKWRVEAITPSETAIVNEPFKYFDAERLDPETLRHRSFTLLWQASEPDVEPTDLFDRWSPHTVTLEVYYRAGVAGLGAEDAHKVMLEDRDDLLTVLRDPKLWAGFSADDPDTATGLQDRIRVGDEIERAPDVWVYRSVWRCKIREIEG